MKFSEWLLTELKTGIDPSTEKLFDLRQKLQKSRSATFHINKNGEVVPGMSDDDKDIWLPYVEIVPGYKKKFDLRLQNIQPTSKLAKNLIDWMKKSIPEVGDWDVELFNLSHAQTGNPDKNYRSANYYQSHPSTEISPNNMPKFLYHGTSTELWHEGIKNKGILPRKLNAFGASGSYGTSVDSLSHENKVYLAVHPDSATRSAAQQASFKHGGLPLILKISTDGLFPEKFGVDEDAISRAEYLKNQNPNVSQIMMGTISYSGRIPFTNIKPIMIQRRAPAESKRVWGKWEQFKGNEERYNNPITDKLNSGSLWLDDPDFFALYDAGLLGLDEEGNRVKLKDVTDADVRAALKSSPWRSTAVAIQKQLSAWGRKGIKSLEYYPAKTDNALQQKIIDALVKNKIYYIQDDRLGLSWMNAQRVIDASLGMAKFLHELGLDYRKFFEIIKEMVATAPPA